MDRTTRDGKRWSAARGYLGQAKGRPNLTVETGALVHGVLLEGTRAIGVACSIRGETQTFLANREVILSGGAINTPQILHLSGIGDTDYLRSVGIGPTHHLPGVGENLNDHPDIVIQHRCKLPVTLYPMTRGPRKWLTGIQWFLSSSGDAASNHFEAGAFIRSRAGIEHPDLQLTLMSLAVIPGTADTVPEHAYQVHIDLMRPKSLGYVRARSADPTQPPAIRFNYLADARDREDLRQSVKLVREILAQPAFDPYRGEELFPGWQVQSDDEIDEWLKMAIETCYHPVGTCKMGASTDPLSVVDSELRVHGLTGLRVVDASIMPSIVSGNTNAPTIMIAEKASDMIRGQAMPRMEEAPVWLHPHWQQAQR